MNPARCPGPGDLMPVFSSHPHDPRTPDADDSDEVEERQDLIFKVRAEIDAAETALFLRDLEKSRKALEEAMFALEEALA
jgi:hypothetical protein